MFSFHFFTLAFPLIGGVFGRNMVFKSFKTLVALPVLQVEVSSDLLTLVLEKIGDAGGDGSSGVALPSRVSDFKEGDIRLSGMEVGGEGRSVNCNEGRGGRVL